MPSVIYEDSLTDTGTSILGGTRVLYVAWEMTVEGPTVRRPVPDDVELLNGLGYFALGNDLTPGGLISGIGLHQAQWFNWEIGQWLPEPSQVGADFPSVVAQYIHWMVRPGSEVHVVVFGDV
jgi:hypothetical protein